MNEIKFKQQQDYVPIFTIPKALTSLLKLDKKDFIHSKDLIRSYISDTKISPYLPVNRFKNSNITLNQKQACFKMLEQSQYGKYHIAGRQFIITQFAIFDVTKEVVPIMVAMIRREYMEYLKMSSLIEKPFPLGVVELWVNHDEHGLSVNFYNRLRSTFHGLIPEDNVKHFTKDKFQTSLFEIYRKPKFLSKKQENIWKKSLLDEFRKKE